MNLKPKNCGPEPVGTRLLVAGVGLICPLGQSAWQTFTALRRGGRLTDRVARLPENLDAVELVRALGCVSIVQHAATDPAVELAEWAAREAIAEARVEPAALPVFLGASKGAIHALTAALVRHQLPESRRRLFAAVATQPLAVDAALVVALGPHGYLAHHLCRRLGVSDVRCTVAACASSLTALHNARRFLLDPGNTNTDAALVVTSEAALLPAFIHSYRRLGVLPPLTPKDYLARPLDRDRRGFLLAEVGAAVLLRRVDRVRPGQIELLDTAIATEGFDLVRAAPGMPALRHVVARLLTGAPIDMLHPHATGTVEHDPAELEVYRAVLASPRPVPVYASKGALGHTLGAAGLVSFVLATLMARTNTGLPMPWLTEPIADATRFAICPSPGADLRTHAVISAGFAGHVAAATLRRA